MAGAQMYKYTGDDGVTYKAGMSPEFATAMGYVAASGTEPSLPSYLRPRFATYVSSTGNYFRAILVPLAFSSTNPPTSVTIGGVTYSRVSYTAELWAAPINDEIIVCSGASGADGAPGVAAPAYTSADTAYSVNSAVTFAHGLGRLPYFVKVLAVCQTNDANNAYLAGDIVDVTGMLTVNSAGTSFGSSARIDPTNVYVAIANGGLIAINRGGGTDFGLTTADWKLRVLAW